MSRPIPPVALSLCALALGSCERAGSSTPPAQMPTPVGAEVEPSGAAPCRVLVNVDGFTHEVRIDQLEQGETGAEQFETREGYVAIVDDAAYELREHQLGQRMQAASLAVRRLPDGEAEFLSDYFGGLSGTGLDIIDECLAAIDTGYADMQSGCSPDHYIDDYLGLTSTLGPYISVSGGTGGYAGGAHGIDDTRMEIWNLGKLGPTQPISAGAERTEGLELLTPSQRAQFERELVEYGVAAFGDDEEESYDYEIGLDDVAGSAFAINPDASVSIDTTIGCCSWVVNHGHFEVSTAFATAPPALAAWLPSERSHRWERAGCGAVDLAGKVYDARGREIADLGASEPPLGVYWLGADHPFRIDWLRPLPDEAPTPPLGDTPPHEAARSAMKEGRHRDAVAYYRRAVEADKGETWLGELGWALFHVGELEQAEALSIEAMAHAGTKAKLAAILYNLGRIHEARGDLEGAAAHYQKSLELRPNATVQARLEALASAKPKPDPAP